MHEGYAHRLQLLPSSGLASRDGWCAVPPPRVGGSTRRASANAELMSLDLFGSPLAAARIAFRAPRDQTYAQTSIGIAGMRDKAMTRATTDMLAPNSVVVRPARGGVRSPVAPVISAPRLGGRGCCRVLPSSPGAADPGDGGALAACLGTSLLLSSVQCGRRPDAVCSSPALKPPAGHSAALTLGVGAQQRGRIIPLQERDETFPDFPAQRFDGATIDGRHPSGQLHR